eukprot:scaffold2036_cov256-Pinguiococcus_pyrenoidosus.AAC.4
MPGQRLEQVSAGWESHMLRFGKDLLAGGLSGIVAKTAFAPVDRVKLLLQTQGASVQLGREQRYRGVVDCVWRVYHEQGFLSFWRGNMANVVRYFPQQAINFACKDQYKAVFVREVGKEDTWRFFLGNLAAGGAAGGTCLVGTYPLDLARTRLAADVGRGLSERQFTGLFDCIVKVFRGGGVLELYHGFPVAFTGIVIFRALYMGGYDFLRHKVLRDDASIFTRFLLAQVVTTTSGTLVYPLDTVRRRLMMQAGRKALGHPVQYTTALGAARHILKREGVQAFYSGILANVIRSGGGALMLILYESFSQIG